MLSRTSLLVLIYHVLTGVAAPSTYDQRQTGNLNVQVHWKDLQIIALLDKDLLDDYTEYDYFYDYADFTVKPTETSTTAASSETTGNPEVGESLNSTQSLSSSTESAVLNSTVEDSSESAALNSTVEESSESVLNFTAEDSSKPSVLNSTVKDSSEPSAVNTDSEYSTEATIEKTDASVSENINIRNTSVNDNSEGEHLGLSLQRNMTRPVKKRCRTECPADGKGRCCRMSNRRLSLVPLAMKLAPKILDSLVHSVKHQSS